MTRIDKTNNSKKRVIESLSKNLGIVTNACKSAGINRTSFYDWYNNDEQFRKEVDDVQELALDFVESKLFVKIKELDTACIIYYLKCKGKHRGYTEKETMKAETSKLNIICDPEMASILGKIGNKE